MEKWTFGPFISNIPSQKKKEKKKKAASYLPGCSSPDVSIQEPRRNIFT